MSGNRSRRKGDNYERDVVAYENSIGLQVRRAKRGNDTGDILGTPDFIQECKNAKQWSLAAWVDQMQLEKLAAGATFGAVIVKRPRVVDVGGHYFIVTVRDGLLLLQQAGIIELIDNTTSGTPNGTP